MTKLDREFHSTIVALAERVRAELQQCETLHRMDFTIEVEGRVHEGDMELKYWIGEYSKELKGNNIDELLTEWLRRHGWELDHQPVCLPNVRTIADS
jgi:hypothetical protein